jgi:hypothetical protein
MPTQIYDSIIVTLVDGSEIYVTPLKIKYLKLFMKEFERVRNAKNDHEALDALCSCVTIMMRQFHPKIKTQEELENAIDLPTIYKILEYAGGVSINEKSDESVKDQATKGGATWEELDLAELESEVFLLGIWKDYEELESSMSMPELTSTLKIKREIDYQNKKFLAAIQGVDLDKESGKQNAWEEMKARVFSKGKAANSKDVLALQGANAQKAGFGIGMGLDYEDLTKK